MTQSVGLVAVFVLLVTGSVEGAAFRFGFDVFAPGTSSPPAGNLVQVGTELIAAGVTQISLVTTRFQQNINSTTLIPSSQNPPLSVISDVVKEFKALPGADKVQVWLKPHVDCYSGVWRAHIGENFDDADWNVWFSNYTTYLGEMSEFAESAGLDGVVVGTEMITATSMQPSKWRNSVIPTVRSKFSGRLTYAANDGFEVNNVSFFDVLDAVGCDAYYSLSTTPSPPISTLIANWKPIMANLSAIAAKWNKPMIFTEIGYRSEPDAALYPGAYQGNQVPDMAAQTTLYSALFQAVMGWDGKSTGVNPPEWLEAVQMWSIEFDPASGGICDNEYTPIRKPALPNVVKKALVQQTDLATKSAHLPSTSSTTPPPSSSPMPVYEGGKFADGWSSWSWGGNYTTSSTTPPLPPNSPASFEAAINPNGAISLHTSSPFQVTSSSTLSIHMRSETPYTGDLIVSLCFDDTCSFPPQRPSYKLGEFLPQSNTTTASECDIPSSWTSPLSSPTVPLSLLIPLNPNGQRNYSLPVHRISIGNQNHTSVHVFLDKMIINKM